MASESQEKTVKQTGSGLSTLYASQIKGKVILTTGTSLGGLGAEFVKALLSSQPSLLILAGRNVMKLQETAQSLNAENSSVKIRTLEIDLASLASVRAAAETVNGWVDTPLIDILVNNAGIMAVDYSLSPDGFEKHFAANHLGPFLFTNLVMDKILKSANPRIIMVTSDGHRLSPIRFEDYNFHNGETYNKWQAYGQSKTANMLMAMSLAEKLGAKRNLLSFSLHPGVIRTNLSAHLDRSVDFGKLFELDRFFGNSIGWLGPAELIKSILTLDEGVATHIYASFDSDIAVKNGSYLKDCHIADPWTETVGPWATHPIEAEKLWKLSEKLVGQEFTY